MESDCNLGLSVTYNIQWCSSKCFYFVFDQENSRMFAGKQIHPFFSSWKAGKKNQEAIELEGSSCLIDRRDKGITCGPIHVFETTQVWYFRVSFSV